MNTDTTSPLHVVFGTGPLGLATMHALVSKGLRVRMVNRSGRAAVPPEVEVVAGDAYSTDFTRHVTQGAAAVYQCAQPEYHEWVEKFPPMQAAILDGAATNGAKLILAENLYMYGDTDGKTMHEGLPYTAHTRKGKVRAQMSQTALQAHQAGKVRVAMARGSDFFGPAVLGSALGERELYPLLAGKQVSGLANIDAPHSYTYINDFGTALATLGTDDRALGQAWHVPNAPTMTTRQILTLFFEEAGLPPKIGSMSPLVLRIGGLFIPAAREVIEMLYEFQKPFVVDSTKFERAFGIQATPIRDAIKPTLAWYKANPHKG
ncbi:MAG: NAD-dependent dehydratase [Armatimonadetes bacterium]|nr:NAD-dependent dehydratase [Anaerolineae bacterium]